MVLLAHLLCQAQAGSLRDWHILAGFSEHYHMALRCILSQHVCAAVILNDPNANFTYMNLDQEDTLHDGRLTRLRQNIAEVIVDNMEFLSVTFIPPMSS